MMLSGVKLKIVPKAIGQYDLWEVHESPARGILYIFVFEA